MTSARFGFFVFVGRLSAVLPSFRGRTRAFLLLHELLGLPGQHVLVDALLRHPAPYRVRLDLHSWLQRVAFLTGGYEPETVSFLLKLHQSMRRPGYLLDVGANVGLIAIPAATLLQQSKEASTARAPSVICIEAVEANVNALRINIALNHAEAAIAVIDQAVGDVEEAVDIQVEGDLRCGEGTGTGNILAGNSTYECVRIPIRVTTLDTLVAAGRLARDCSVMKIDTDGYDLKVLQGGVEFLRRARPVIFGEFAEQCLRWHGQTVRDVVRFSDENGYRVWQKRDGRAFQFTAKVDSEAFVQDLLLVPLEDAGRLEWCCSNGL